MLSRASILAQIAAVPQSEVERHPALRSLVRGLGQLIQADEKSDREWAKEWVGDNRAALLEAGLEGKTSNDAAYDLLWAQNEDYSDELFDLVVAAVDEMWAEEVSARNLSPV